MNLFRRTTILAIGFILIAFNLVSAQEKTPKFDAQQLEFFESKVRPILVERCFDCHGPESKPLEGSLSLASRKAMIAGGDTGAAIEPGNAADSLLIDAINYGEVYEMPPDTKMPDEEIAILTKWVNMEAPWPAETDVAIETGKEFDLDKRKSEHWAWKPVRKQKIPKVKDESWASDPIDHFILEKLESVNLAPAEPADKPTLIRRAYFDFIGLPPTPGQVDAFVKDVSPDAFEKVVDELLASPHFGERWARHWMDLTRYAESGGHEFDYNINYAFRYRDYLIRAFNEDVSYKQFITEHIAGDLIKNPRRNKKQQFNESILGTGFWFLGEAKHGAVDSRDEEARTIDNQIDVMSKTFLGLTVACARCHDHKFDAISAEDYYALAGFLQSSRRQEVMLDVDRKIEASHNRASELANKASRTLDEVVTRLQKTDASKVTGYFEAAIEVLRKDQSWLNKSQLMVEGESLKRLSISAGEGLVQEIKPQGNFKWRGNKQYWWKHGKPGDSLTLEFALPESNTDGEYEIKGVFTTAGDYGAATLAVNDKVLLKARDFYSANLGTTGEISLGKAKLSHGKNTLTVTLNERNEKAAPSDMFGVDYLVLVAPKLAKSQLQEMVDGIAEERKLDEQLLSRLVAALMSPEVRRQKHPLHLAYVACKSGSSLDAKFSDQLTDRVAKNEQRFKKAQKESVLFADFKNGLPDGWFRTGFAFQNETPATSNLISASGDVVAERGVISSGRLGSNFYGVVRSPTFDLKHGQINYRVKGNGITVRLVVNGFLMDEFNALLYKQCKMPLKPSEEFRWEVQRGDIPNHVGQRAHLEIIDHGSGFAVLDEIRFSNGGRVFDPETAVVKQVAGSFESQKEFASSFANAISKELREKGPQFEAVASWVIEKDLVELFSSDDRVSQSENRSTATFVSVATKPRSTSELVEEVKSIRSELQKINNDVSAPLLAIGMCDGNGEEERIFIRGNHKTLGDVATRRFLSAISARPLNPPDGSGRLLLAQKITAPNNPLTARVAVNRLWHHMFGRGIVESVDDFGKLGKLPTHPELLDYLATDFTKNRWSVKRLLKRIALTRTYQMSSRSNPDAKTNDPDNLLLHRGNIRRLQGEAIRDAMLSISGRLDRAMYGPSVPIHLTNFMQGRGRPRKSGPLDGNGRRSIYIAVRRNFLSPMMLAFDTPIPFNSIGKRNQSNVPAQSLILMNDPFVIGQAKRWAEELVEREAMVKDRIEEIYAVALGRKPTKMEFEKAKSFVELQANELGLEKADQLSSVELWQDFCHVVFNLKEFIYIN